jgi:hypothetical protein
MSWCRFFLQTISPSNDWLRLLDWAEETRGRKALVPGRLQAGPEISC